MTIPDTAVQIKLLILFTVGIIALITAIVLSIRRDHRIALTSTLPLMIVAAFMLIVLVILAML